MVKIEKEKHLNLNYADDKHGLSLLNWCIISLKIKAFEKLLELGADPNWQDTFRRFAPPITNAAEENTTSKYLELSLKYNGNVNLLSKKTEGIQEQTPLLGAIYSNRMESIKMLVDKGADVNLTTDSFWSPLAEALIQKKIAVAKYLLDKGADYNNMRFTTIDGQKLNILDFLRDNVFRLNSDQYKIKMEIVTFLKTIGLDYWKDPIPDNIKSSYKDDKEFLSKY